MAWLAFLRKESRSFIPVLGGLAGAVGVPLAPIDWIETRPLVMPAPLILDVGCVPVTTIYLWTRRRSRHPPAS